VKLPPTAEFDVASLTDVGRLRNSNQDAFGERERSHGHWFVVADGMGGHAGGETAARIAVETIVEAAGGGLGPDERLHSAFQDANAKIHQTGLDDARLAGMGTTAVALAFEQGACWVGNVGDSRAYRLRGDALEAVSRDHSVVAEFVRRGYISEAQARTHPRRNELLRSLGISAEVEVDVDPVEARPGDTFMLCSDGLCGVIDDPAIAEILRDGSASEAAEALVTAANNLGGPDNITVQVIRIPRPQGGAKHIAGVALAMLTGALALWALVRAGA
jgi:protein phosphatase